MPDKSDIPSNFTLKLRKHIRGRRLEAVRQLGVDRVVEFEFGSGENCHHIILEMYSQVLPLPLLLSCFIVMYLGMCLACIRLYAMRIYTYKYTYVYQYLMYINIQICHFILDLQSIAVALCGDGA